MHTSPVLPQVLRALLVHPPAHHLVFASIPPLFLSCDITLAALALHFPIQGQCLMLASGSGFLGT